MPRRKRVALPAVALIVLAGLALAWVLTRQPSPNAPCGDGSQSAYLADVMGPAQEIAAQEHDGPAERFALATVLSDQALAQGVQAHNMASVRHELLRLLYNHEHIVRLRVTRGGHLVMNIGGADVLQPVSGPLLLAGRQVGRVEISIQDDMGYMLLDQRLLGADAVLRYGSQTEVSDIATGSLQLPQSGAITLAGKRYLVGSFFATRFPSGPLRISVLIGAPPRRIARQTCAGIRADVYAGVVRRVYEASLIGPAATIATDVVGGSLRLRQALQSGAPGPLLSAVSALAGTNHVIALRVFGGGGRLLAQAGPTAGTIAPVTGALLAPGTQQRIGSYALTVQTAAGDIAIARPLVAAPVLMRVDGRPLPGTPDGPAILPASGVVRFHGQRYAVRSFLAGAFPSGAVRVYVLVPQ
ncbi:MAG: hypothetical protein ABSG64_00370 [Solirubrobacteraceae bacterium]|jgi:hypothetical protein